MKKASTIFLTGIFTGIILCFALLILVAPRLIFTVSESKDDFARTRVLIEKATLDNKWSMPYQYDLQATMSNHRFPVKPVTVFSICNPDIAVRILASDANRYISAIIPCRIAIYERANGKTYISRLNTGLLSIFGENEVKAVISDAETGIDKILEQVISK